MFGGFFTPFNCKFLFKSNIFFSEFSSPTTPCTQVVKEETIFVNRGFCYHDILTLDTQKTLRVTFCIYYGSVCKMEEPNSPNDVSKKPFENHFRKYKIEFVWIYIYQLRWLFNFHPWGSPQTTENVLCIFNMCNKTKTNTKTILILHNSMTLPLQNTVIRISKDANEFVKKITFNILINIMGKVWFWQLKWQRSLPGNMDFVVPMVFQKKQ